MVTQVDFLAGSAALCDAVLQLRGSQLAAELGRIARLVLLSPQGQFLAAEADARHFSGDLARTPARTRAHTPAETPCTLSQDIVFEGCYFGRFIVAGRSHYDCPERQQLAALAALAARMLHLQTLTQRATDANAQIEAQLQHQSQILDQMHESVLTIDCAGDITSWNPGAERLFGYSELEAVGRNILFLHADDASSFNEAFALQGGCVMEVRRRKKSGQVFWASLALSPLTDGAERAIGLIAYMSDITERKLVEERIHHLAYYDVLTGLPNRSLLIKLVNQALAQALRGKLLGCVLFVDLNRFKPINDTLGRRIGDQLLRQIAQRFRSVLREQDLVARMGGDEFAVALSDIGDPLEAGVVAQKLLASLVPPFLIEGYELRAGASIGISVYPQDGVDAETLLRLADIAMFRAKQGGDSDTGSVAFYSQDMNQGMLARMHVETDLRRALAQGELLLHYQPKYALASGRIIGAEALVRWSHPVRGLVPPGEFIPLAEATGLVVQIGAWVLEAACMQAQLWCQAGLPPLRLAVNVSAREFTSCLPARVERTLQRYGLTPQWLELEITESTLMDNIECVIGIMDRITALGVSLSLDDFGTGYSSLSYLKRFPIDTLKIDRSFISAIPGDANDCAIASAIIGIARQLKHKVIAEGVETMAQLQFLKDAGCDQVQGYLFSHPLPADDFERVLRENWSPGQ